MDKRTKTDDLTMLMHSEFSVGPATDQKHATWTALDAIKDGDMTREEAMAEYGVTEIDFGLYSLEWSQLNNENKSHCTWFESFYMGQFR